MAEVRERGAEVTATASAVCMQVLSAAQEAAVRRAAAGTVGAGPFSLSAMRSTPARGGRVDTRGDDILGGCVASGARRGRGMLLLLAGA
jgi:hypothetical protein